MATARLLLLGLLGLLAGAEAAPGVGYALEFGRRSVTSSPKSRLGGLGLQAAGGWTVSAWLRYADRSQSVLMSEINMVSACDSNHLNGFGGPGAPNFALSSGHTYLDYLPTAEDFLDWHHFAMSFDAVAQIAAHWVDGVKVSEKSLTSYACLSEQWDEDMALNFGIMCYHGPEGSVRSCISNRMFLGQLDDFALFVGVLSEAEMAERWNSSIAPRIADGLEPKLAIFYDFNDPLTTPGEVANLGYAGADFDLMHGRLDGSQSGLVYHAADDTEPELLSPSFVATVPIAGKAAEDPAGTPLVAYAAPGATVDLAAELGMADGQSFTAPAPFNTTAVLVDVPTAAGGTATVHVVPLAAPEPMDELWRVVTTIEDSAKVIVLLTGAGHTWNEGTLRVLARPPSHGVLYEQERREDRVLTWPVTERGALITKSANVLYVPEENGFGDGFDSFEVIYRLNGTDDGGVYESAPFNVTIDILPEDDLPTVSDQALRIDEDSASPGLASGHEIMLQLNDSELGQVLAGHITTLPTKGTLYAVNGSGHRTAINAQYNPFDVGSPVLRQYLSRVVAVSSFWGSSPPYAGYHPLGILGPPDCEDNQVAAECTPDQPWVGDPSIFPELGVHVQVNGHTAYVRAIHAAASDTGGDAGALDVEMHQYYKWNASLADWEPCYMDPYAAGTYPDDCLSAAEGGGLNDAFGRPALLTVSRSAIVAMPAAVWCPNRMGYVGDTLLAGGGMFGPEFVYSHRQSDYYGGTIPYTEWIEVAVATPVYIFGIVVGMPRGVGSVVGIRARNPSQPEGSGSEWVRMYEATPLLGEYEKNRDSGGVSTPPQSLP